MLSKSLSGSFLNNNSSICPANVNFVVCSKSSALVTGWSFLIKAKRTYHFGQSVLSVDRWLRYLALSLLKSFTLSFLFLGSGSPVGSFVPPHVAT